jgi:hypothetical protein
MKVLLFSIFLAVFTPSHAQDADELNRRNGFKTIKLANPIDSVKGAIFKKEFKERDEFPAKLYEVASEEYKTIGDVNVKEIQLMTYKNLIYKIVVWTEKDPRVMKALEKSFGKSAYVVRTSSYNWVAEKLSLTFRAHRNSLELIYRSYPVIRKMQEDKGRKVDEIAEDF